MREQMKALDDLEMGDLWTQALQRTPRPDPGPEPHRTSARTRIVAAVVAIAVFVLAGVFALNAFDERQHPMGGSRTVPAANCPESLPTGAIAVVTCEQAADQAWGVAVFIDTADSAEVSWREYPGSFEGQTISSWLVTFSGAQYVAGSDGCSASGSLVAYTVVVSASSGARVASDGPPEGCSVAQQIAPLVELPSDPCALVTSDQVAAATSSNVLSSHQLDGSDQIVPGPPYPCDFATEGRFGHVGVVSVPNDPQGFSDLLNKDPINREIVGGIGDGAFISGRSEIVVALGDGYYSIGFQHGAGADAEPVLRSLAHDALHNLTAADASTQPASNRLSLTRFKLESGITGLAFGFGSLWVAQQQEVDRVDVTTGEVTARIPFSSGDYGTLVVTSTAVWVTDGTASVSEIDPSQESIVKEVAIGGVIRGLTANENDVWVSSTADGGALSRIGSDGSVVASAPVPPGSLVYSDGLLWVLQGGSVLGLDPMTLAERLDPIRIEGPRTVADGSIWSISNEGAAGAQVVQTDIASGASLSSSLVPRAGDVRADSAGVWVLSAPGSTSDALYIPDPDQPARVSLLDPTTGEEIAESIAVDNTPARVAVGDGGFWVSHYDPGTVSWIDAEPVGQ